MIKLPYRPEIDGLRAISVIAVVFYHIEIVFYDFKLFSGGFIGVDVFFVISGYLITSLILKEIYQTQNFSLLNFYKRRSKRILPALFGMIIISIFFAWIYLTPDNFEQYSNSIISSIFFFSNFFFYFEGLVYNAENSLLKPLLHTWSLSVEEQFYIFFPLLLIFLFKFLKKDFFQFFLILFILSFSISVFTSMNNPSLSFFSTISRIWEFLAGSFLALRETKNKIFKNRYENILSFSGLTLIILSFIFFNNNTFHPSYLTLVPIIGAVLVIISSDPKTFVNKILSSFIFVRIGLISYSLYLWHFPVFAFARNRGKDLSDFDKIELLGITIVLSLLSYFLIEKPFRNKRLIPFKYFLSIILLSLVALVSLNNYSNKTNGFENRIHVFLKNTQRINQEYQVQDNNGVCFDRIKDFCNFNTKFEKSVILVGDSHLEILSENIFEKAKSSNLNYISMNRGGCIYLPNIKKIFKKNNQEVNYCTLESKKIIDETISKNPESIIILGGFYREYFANEFVEEYDWEFQNDTNLKPINNFVESLKNLLNRGYKVILLYPVPSPDFNVVKRLMREIPKSSPDATKYLKENPLTFSLEKYYSDNQKIIKEFDKVNHENLIKIYPVEHLCNIEKKLCFTHSDKEIYYADEHHLANEGIRIITNEINKSIDLLVK